MKSRLRPSYNRLALLLALCTATRVLAALTPTEWSQRQSLQVDAPGLVRVNLTEATFDTAGPEQQDLRIVDANGREIASWLDDPPVPQARTVRPASFDVKLAPGATVITLVTGTKETLASVSLETPHPFFMRAVHLELSDDGDHWTTLDQGLPLFRQWGAEKLELSLGQQLAAYVRVTVPNNRGATLPFTGASLRLAAAPGPALVPVGAQIISRDEFAGETVLTLALDGRHLPLAALEFDTHESLFTRRVTVTVREVRAAVPGERTVGAGTLYRVALDGAPSRAQLELPLNFTAPTRELLVHIHNGDSPPLVLTNVRLKRWPVSLLFLAPTAGTYTLLSGNSQAVAPQYDLAGFAPDLRSATATAVTPAGLEAMPNYRPRESLATAPLPDISLAGAPIDTRDWPARRAIAIERSGVQELELDLAALAQSRPNFADLRIVREDKQIPYVLELPALARPLTLQPAIITDPKRPSVSVWQLHLPQSGLPLRRLVLTSTTRLFLRGFRIYEKLTSPEGRAYETELAGGVWSRTPDPGVPETRIFELSQRMQTDTLWIETENGDNPAIALGKVQVVYPVARLIFKVADPAGFELIYGNPAANAPRYDLSLVAVKLLTSSRNVARLSADDAISARPNTFARIKGGMLFWAALVLVVIVLLVVVAKLLPKPPAA